MSAANPDNELTRARRDNARLLKRLLDVMDQGQNYNERLYTIESRLADLEALIEHARTTSTKRRGQQNSEPANQITPTKE